MCSLSVLSTSTEKKNGMGIAKDPESTKKAVKKKYLKENIF